MPTATWNDTVIARSDETVVVEGNHYFPRDSVSEDHVAPSDESSICPWKGTASYLDVKVGEEVNAAAAWYYPEPKEAAENIRDHVAFWNGVTVGD